MMEHNAACFASYMGLWAMLPERLRAAFAHVRSGTIRAAVLGQPAGPPEERAYALVDNVAVIFIDGMTMKADSKFGGTSTVRVRRALRDAMAEDAVDAILLRVDSPGGHVAGTMELADDVAAAASRKEVHAFGEDLMASAAYWAVSRASRITANALAEVGSIGVYGVLVDESQAAEMAGVKVHVVSSGPMKGAGHPGTEVTPEVLADVQTFVDAVSAEFFGAVRKGRKLSAGALAKVATGGTWIAPEAVGLGLLDAVGTWEDALRIASADGRGRRKRMSAADRARRMGS